MKYPRLFWAIILPIAVVSYPITNWLAPILAPHGLTPAEIREVFIEFHVPWCAPEPEEQATYALAVVVPVALMFGSVLLLKRSGLFRRDERRCFWIPLTAIVAQLLIVSIAGYAWLYEIEHGWKTELHNFAPAQILIGLCVAAYFGFRWLHADHRRFVVSIWQHFSRSSWPAWLIATGWAIAHLLSCVFTDDNIGMASRVLGNVKFQLDEFAAVVNGLIPLVNYQPVYENVLAYLLYPYFAIAGISITKFTLAMTSLSLIGFLLIYRVFSRLVRSSWLGLVLFVPWVAVTMANLEPPNLPPASNFQYYAVGPIRYFGVFLLAYLSIWYLTIPRVRRLMVASFVAGIVALNNLDFGIPAALGFLACVTLFPPADRMLGRFARTLRASVIFAGCATLAIATYWVGVRVVLGSWPQFKALTQFQRIFAVAGYNLQKLPPAGLYWDVYLTFMIALMYAVFDGFSQDSFKRRLSTGMLAYGGIAGLGSMSYYIARSHPSVITAAYGNWAFVLTLLVHRFLSEVREARLRRLDVGYSVYAIPTVAVLAMCAGLSPLVLEVPKIRDEYKRLTYSAGGQANATHSHLVSVISKYVKKNDATVIMYPHGHLLAIKASVRNIFPYTDPDIVTIKFQVQQIMARIKSLPPNKRYVFSSLFEPIVDMLSDAGFERIEVDGDFAVWRSRDAQSPLVPNRQK